LDVHWRKTGKWFSETILRRSTTIGGEMVKLQHITWDGKRGWEETKAEVCGGATKRKEIRD
jgi:hypothetical protein